MANPAKTYVKSIAKKSRYRAIWLPGIPLQLGDYGVLEEGYFFRRLGNIRTIGDGGISFAIRPDETKDAFLSYGSDRGVTCRTELAGDVPLSKGQVTTKVTYEFSSKDAYIFELRDVEYTSIEDIAKVGQAIMGLFAQRENSPIWEKDYYVITELVTAASGTILVSNSSNGKLGLTVKGNFLKDLDIADATLGLSITYTQDMEVKSIAESGLTPLFRLSGIRSRGILRPTNVFEPRRLRQSPFSVANFTDTEVLNNLEKFDFAPEDFGYLFMEDDE